MYVLCGANSNYFGISNKFSFLQKNEPSLAGVGMCVGILSFLAKSMILLFLNFSLSLSIVFHTDNKSHHDDSKSGMGPSISPGTQSTAVSEVWYTASHTHMNCNFVWILNNSCYRKSGTRN